MVETPVVSVLLVVRNGAATLPLALRSIEAQPESGWELLAYDDGSSDDTTRILQDWASADSRIRVFTSLQSRGLASRLNELVSESRAPYIARMDADDVSYPSRLRRQLEFLETHPAVDVVGASMAIFREAGSLCGKRAAPPVHRQIVGMPLRSFRIFHPTWVGRAEWFRRHPYDARALLSEDQELLYRALPASTYANVTDILLGYRAERLSLSRSMRASCHMSWRTALLATRRGRAAHPV